MRTSVDVHNFLLEREIPHELVPVRGRLRSPDRVAAVLGLPPEQVARVVILEGRGRLIAVLLPSDRRPDLDRVTEVTGVAGLAEPTPERVTDLTDFLAEAVPPAGLPDGARVIMDRSLSEQEVLYFSGGETSSLLKIRPADLVRATGAKLARVAR